MTKIAIFDNETGGVVEREMTLAESKQWEKDQAETNARIAKQAEAEAAKSAAQAKLEALGLTTDDLKALGL